MKNIYYSTNKNSPNIIQIFTDGFDPELVADKLSNDKNLVDFNLFNKFVVAGAETSYSYPTIIGGLKYNNFTYENKLGNDIGARFGKITKAFSENLNTHPAKNTYLLNTDSLTNKGESYWRSHSGDPAFVKKNIPQFGNVLN